MATFVNDLRLTELATGEGSGTWGTTTNQSLELIGESLGYATQQAFSSDADATTTVADGVSDPARAMYFKVTSAGSLSATRTLTIAPNTISRVMFIENATSGSQSIAISQGSGANVTIATGKTAVVYLDGAGSGAAVVDAMAGVDPGVTDTLAEVLVAGNTSGGTNIELSTTDKVQFRDTGIYINSSADGQLDIVADTEIQIAATTIDINGAINASGEIIAASLDISGDIDVDGTANLDIVDIDGAVNMATTALVTGVLTTTAATVHTNGITMPDDAKAIFGTGSDFEIYFNGTHGVMRTASASVGGNIYIQDDNNIVLGSIGGENYLNAAKDGAVTLYYDNSAKLATSSSGISVTGGFTATAASTITTADNSTQLTLISTDADASAGPVLDLYRNSASPANNDFLGNITFRGRNNNSQDVQFAEVEVYVTDVADGAEDGLVNYNVMTNGSNLSYLQLRGETATVVINEDGADIDFRVESDGNANMLFVDGGANRVGVGRSGPQSIFEVHIDTNKNIGYSGAQGELGSIPALVAYNDAGSLADIGFRGTTVRFASTSQERMRIDETGVVANEGSHDADFRVESDNSSSMLFVDASTDRVGVGVAAPTNTFDVQSSDTNAVRIRGTSNVPLYSYGDGGGVGWATGPTTNYGELIYLDETNSKISLYTGGVQRFVIGAAETVFNENSANTDFRVESDGNANMLFVNGGANSVSIGTSVNLGGTLNLYNGSFRGQAAGALTATMMTPTAFGYAPGTYAVTMLGAPNTSGTVSIGYDPSGNPSGAFGGSGTETLFSGNMYFTQPNATDDGYVTQIRMENQTGVTINENGADLNFRVESDGNANMLFVDGGSNFVALGNNTANPASGFSATGGVGYTSGGGMQIASNTSGASLVLGQNFATNGSICDFRKQSTIVGSISVTGSATAYNTSSDQRLKQNIADADDSGNLIDAIQVRKFDWKIDGSHQDYGMVAQELIEVAPEAVSAPENPDDMMGVDYSKLVPMLIKEIQSLRARVADLES